MQMMQVLRAIGLPQNGDVFGLPQKGEHKHTTHTYTHITKPTYTHTQTHHTHHTHTHTTHIAKSPHILCQFVENCKRVSDIFQSSYSYRWKFYLRR